MDTLRWIEVDRDRLEEVERLKIQGWSVVGVVPHRRGTRREIWLTRDLMNIPGVVDLSGGEGLREGDLLTVRDAAAILQVSEDTVRRRFREGKLAGRRDGRSIRILRRSLG